MNQRTSGLVWILSGVALIIYGVLSLTRQGIPGVEQLVDFVGSVQGVYIYLGAFITTLIEGLYIVGSFFPGTTLIVIVSILSQTGGLSTFLLTLLAIFLAWNLAGAINILFAKLYHKKILKKVHNPEHVIVDRPFTTWYPAFRANYDVAQVVEGADPMRVFFSSMRVKLYACVFLLVTMMLMPLIIDINNLGNEEGLVTLVIVAIISITVGGFKIRDAKKEGTTGRFY